MTPLWTPDAQNALAGYENLAPFCQPLVVAGGVAAFTGAVFDGGKVDIGVAASVFAVRWLDPADWAPGSRTAKVRVRGEVKTGSVAPAVTFTFGLYPVATWTAPASNIRSGVATLGVAVASTAVASPGANTRTHSESAAAALSAADWYLAVIATSGTTAANSQNDLAIWVQRQVT